MTIRDTIIMMTMKMTTIGIKEEMNMAKGHGVSGNTHSRGQLNNYANQMNPNNSANRANGNNHANQMNPNNSAYHSSRGGNKSGK